MRSQPRASTLIAEEYVISRDPDEPKGCFYDPTSGLREVENYISNTTRWLTLFYKGVVNDQRPDQLELVEAWLARESRRAAGARKRLAQDPEGR